jgi:hypothetical protein
MQGVSQLRQVLGLTTESCDLFNQFRNKLNNSLEQNCPGYKISIKQIFLNKNSQTMFIALYYLFI